MTIGEAITTMMDWRGVKLAQLGRMMGYYNASPINRMKRLNSAHFNTLHKMADLMGFDVILRDKGSMTTWSLVPNDSADESGIRMRDMLSHMASYRGVPEYTVGMKMGYASNGSISLNKQAKGMVMDRAIRIADACDFQIVLVSRPPHGGMYITLTQPKEV